MELRHLRYFEAIARHGSMTRAAEALHVAQPALSKQMHALEMELGVTLFNRVGRGIELAAAGQVLLPYCRRILNEATAAVAAMEALRDLSAGRVALGAPPTVGTQLLPQALAAFNTLHSGIDLELRERGAGELLELLGTGHIDLAVVPGPIGSVQWSGLFTESLVIAVGANHRLANASLVTAAELANEAWILFPEGYELRGRTLALCQQAGFTPRVVLDGAEMDTVLRLTAAGLGIAVVPQLALRDTTGLQGIAVADIPLERTLGLIWHPERPLSAAATALRHFLIERLRRVGEGVTLVE